MSWKSFIQFFILVYILIGIKFGNIETENITIQDKNTKYNKQDTSIGKSLITCLDWKGLQPIVTLILILY